MSDLAAIGLELAVVLTGLGVLLAELWLPPEQRHRPGRAVAVALGLILLASFAISPEPPRAAFGGMYALDELALFFKRLFLLAALLVTVIALEFADRFEAGHSEYHALTLFALAGMMFAASARHFALLFVALELVTVTFYVLVSFQRRRVTALEAGAKYLILGALSSAFLVYGIALVYAATGTLAFGALAGSTAALADNRLLTTGLLLVFVGLAFKIAAVPFQIWAPDVYQGAPFPSTAFLAVGSKAAGLVLLLRVLFEAAPGLTTRADGLLPAVAVLTMFYGALCAIPQRSLRRLMAYSSIANAGFLLVGFACGSAEGVAAVLFYLAGYLFAVLAVFLVATLVWRGTDTDDIPALAGLGQRAPWLAASLTLAATSLAGVPPLAGFLGKFLLLKAAIQAGAANPALYGLAAATVVAAVISLYYYFGLVRAVYWGNEEPGIPLAPVLAVSGPARAALVLCAAGLLWLGVFPATVLELARRAAATLAF